MFCNNEIEDDENPHNNNSNRIAVMDTVNTANEKEEEEEFEDETDHQERTEREASITAGGNAVLNMMNSNDGIDEDIQDIDNDVKKVTKNRDCNVLNLTVDTDFSDLEDNNIDVNMESAGGGGRAKSLIFGTFETDSSEETNEKEEKEEKEKEADKRPGMLRAFSNTYNSMYNSFRPRNRKKMDDDIIIQNQTNNENMDIESSMTGTIPRSSIAGSATTASTATGGTFINGGGSRARKSSIFSSVYNSFFTSFRRTGVWQQSYYYYSTRFSYIELSRCNECILTTVRLINLLDLLCGILALVFTIFVIRENKPLSRESPQLSSLVWLLSTTSILLSSSICVVHGISSSRCGRYELVLGSCVSIYLCCIYLKFAISLLISEAFVTSFSETVFVDPFNIVNGFILAYPSESAYFFIAVSIAQLYKAIALNYVWRKFLDLEDTEELYDEELDEEDEEKDENKEEINGSIIKTHAQQQPQPKAYTNQDYGIGHHNIDGEKGDKMVHFAVSDDLAPLEEGDEDEE